MVELQMFYKVRKMSLLLFVQLLCQTTLYFVILITWFDKAMEKIKIIRVICFVPWWFE